MTFRTSLLWVAAWIKVTFDALFYVAARVLGLLFVAVLALCLLKVFGLVQLRPVEVKPVEVQLRPLIAGGHP